MGPHEDLEKISNCLTAMPNETSEHMWESEQKFFQKFILKKNLGGLLKFSIFDENSHFLSI